MDDFVFDVLSNKIASASIRILLCLNIGTLYIGLSLGAEYFVIWSIRFWLSFTHKCETFEHLSITS